MYRPYRQRRPLYEAPQFENLDVDTEMFLELVRLYELKELPIEDISNEHRIIFKALSFIKQDDENVYITFHGGKYIIDRILTNFKGHRKAG